MTERLFLNFFSSNPQDINFIHNPFINDQIEDDDIDVGLRSGVYKLGRVHTSG